VGDEVGEFGGLAGIRQGEDHVAGDDHAEIAVRGLGGMDEQRGGAGRGQRRGDLARDMAGLAHAGDHDAAGRTRHQLDRAGEPHVETGRQSLKSGSLRAQDGPGDVEVARVSRICHRGGNGGSH
jgi:hypothetical protein